MTAATSTPPAGLPTEKRPAKGGIGKVWVYGEAGVGKSTTAADLDPDHGLILDTEGSTSALEAFVLDLGSWEEFLKRLRELEKGGHDFETVTIDTVDVLAKLCADSVLHGLAGPGAKERFLHASDFEWGKGWSAIEDEFSLRIAKLCTIVPNVVFISHAEEGTVKERSGLERTVMRPDLKPKGLRAFLEGFVNHIAFAEIDADGNRVIHLQPSANYVAKVRVPKGVKAPADPLAMRGPVLRKALEALGKKP
jgi:hypothetical protein